MVGTDKRSIPGEFSQRQLTFFSCYRLGLVIKTPWRKNETQQKIHKKCTACSPSRLRAQLKQARREDRLQQPGQNQGLVSPARLLPFPPRWCGLRLSHLMDKQGSLPAERWTTLRKQTNKSNQASDLEANDRYDWSGDQLEAVTTRLRETGRVWLFHGPEIITGY